MQKTAVSVACIFSRKEFREDENKEEDATGVINSRVKFLAKQYAQVELIISCNLCESLD